MRTSDIIITAITCIPLAMLVARCALHIAAQRRGRRMLREVQQRIEVLERMAAEGSLPPAPPTIWRPNETPGFFWAELPKR